MLEVCLEARHPVTITTKSARVLRDLDLLGELAALKLTAVALPVTSLDPVLSGKLEANSAIQGSAAIASACAARNDEWGDVTPRTGSAGCPPPPPCGGAAHRGRSPGS